jgi:hypothetical protein
MVAEEVVAEEATNVLRLAWLAWLAWLAGLLALATCSTPPFQGRHATSMFDPAPGSDGAGGGGGGSGM